MSTEQQNALLQEGLDQSWFFRQYAALKNGIPTAPLRNVIGTAKPTPPTKEIVYVPKETSSVKETSVTSQVTAEPKKNSLLKTAALMTGLAVGGGAGGAAITNWLYSEPSQQVVVEPPAPLTTDKYGDLLKYLLENGYNLPPKVTDASPANTPASN